MDDRAQGGKVESGRRRCGMELEARIAGRQAGPFVFSAVAATARRSMTGWEERITALRDEASSV